MFDLDKWQEIYASLSRHKLRTSLTAFGVFWGMFMLVVLMGTSNSLERGGLAGFGNLANGVWLWSARPTSMDYMGLSKGRWVKLDDADLQAIRDEVSGIDDVFPTNYLGSQYVKFKDKGDSYDVDGVYPQAIISESLTLNSGRFINQNDLKERRKVAVIGARAQQILFPDGGAIGKYIVIQGVIPFKVVGVVTTTLNRSGGLRRTADEKVFIPNSTLRVTFNQSDRFANLLTLVTPGVDAHSVQQEILTLMKQRNLIHPDDPTPLGSYNNQPEFLKYQGLFNGIRWFSWLVAIGTILAGAIGVGNIMLIVVKERTKEIGVRKSLGATPASITKMVIQETLILTSFSGYIGLTVGVLVLEGVSLLNKENTESILVNPDIDFSTALIALSVLIVSGLVASAMPAYKAACIDPVLALQEK